MSRRISCEGDTGHACMLCPSLSLLSAYVVVSIQLPIRYHVKLIGNNYVLVNISITTDVESVLLPYIVIKC